MEALVIEKPFDILYGVNPVLEALRAKKRKAIRLYLSETRHDKYSDLIKRMAKQESIPLDIISKHEISKLTLSSSNQGIAGKFEPYPYVDIQTIIEAAKKEHENPFIIALDEVQDPHNTGAIIRTASCLGWHGIIITKRRSAGITPGVVKVSSGATEYVNIAMVSNLRAEVESFKKDGFVTVGLDMHGKSDFEDVTKGKGIILIVGGEESGIRKPVFEVCDYIVSIPMKGHPDSLNASVSAGIALYTLRKLFTQK
jgi:23S rRNA (guanosine2251-2'-O)-methyltransferase